VSTVKDVNLYGTSDGYLADARELIERDERHGKARDAEQRELHIAAAEKIAAAMMVDKKLTQRKVAEKIGKSAAWVNTLIAWRANGYEEPTAFGPQAKEARAKAARLVATKQEPHATAREKAARDRARAEAKTARAKADEAKAKAKKASEERRKAEANAKMVGKKANISAEARERLVKFLGMIGSKHAGERDTAATMAEQLRQELNVSWDDLIVQATR
jgi:hypothetical protein